MGFIAAQRADLVTLGAHEVRREAVVVERGESGNGYEERKIHARDLPAELSERAPLLPSRVVALID
jgi:hypothetical protein